MIRKCNPMLYLAASPRFFAKEISVCLSGLLSVPFYIAPNMVDIHLTFRCNLRCQQCGIWAREPEEELSTETWKKIILDIRRTVGPSFVRFYGGEPMMRNDLMELFDYCSRHQVIPFLTTNATLIDEAKASKMAEYGVGCVHISLDGFRPETHDRLRGIPGTHGRVMSAIGYLRGRVPIQINTTIMDDNLEEILDLADWARLNKLPISFQGVISLGWNHRKNGYKKPSHFPEDSKKAEMVLRALSQKAEKNRFIINSLVHLKRLEMYYRNHLLLMKKKCEAISHHIVIRSNGDIFPCPFFGPMGNMTRKPLRDIWNAAEGREKMREMEQCPVTTCLIMRGCFKENWSEFFSKVKRSLLFRI